MIRRAAVLVALAAAWLPPAWCAADDRPPPAVVGAPIPAGPPSPAAASLFRPAAIHATFRVPQAGTALYVGTPWFVRDLTVTITGPGGRRATIPATSDLPGHMLGVRLPADAWQADRIDVDASTVSTAAPPYLLAAEQLAFIGWRNWSYAAFFGLFVALALAGAGLALRHRSRTAAWYAVAAAAQAGLLVPWLGIVRPPPEISQPLHAALQSLAFVALALFAFAFLRGVRIPRSAATALWALVALNVVAVTAGDVLQDLYPLPDLATQSIAGAFDLAYVVLAVIAIRANGAGAISFLAATALGAIGFIAGIVTQLAAFPPLAATLLQSAPLEATALETVLLALALTAHLHHPREQTAAAQATTPAHRRTQPAHLDGLTEIPNRTGLDEHLTAAWERARRTNTPLAALLLDIDHFHTYNDTYGHLAGDDVLRRIAATLTATASRNDDVAGRYDGDKFLALLPATDLAGARHIADALRTAVNALDLANGAVPSKRLTVSIGVASVIPQAAAVSIGAPPAGVTVTAADAPELLRRAATALHVAKTMGRNRAVADEPIAPPIAFR